VISGKLALNHSSVVSPSLGVVGQNHDAVAGRRATDDEVVRVIVQPPLPPMKGWTEFDTPACAPGELVVDAPEGLPPRIIEPEGVGQEPPVIGRRGQKRPVPVKTGFRIGETASVHAERSEDPVPGERGDRHAGTSLQVLLEQHKTFAGVAPALPGWPQGLEGLSFWAPVRKPGGVSQDVAYRDVAGNGLVEVLDELERQVREDLLHQRRRVHHGRIAINPSELPVAHNADRPTHSSSGYADQCPLAGDWGTGARRGRTGYGGTIHR
jgi:hypothetical protein